MHWRQKVLRVSAAVAVAFAAAHTAESLKAPIGERSLLASNQLAVDEPPADRPVESAVPQSASLSTPVGDGVNNLIGITSVAAAAPPRCGRWL